MRKFKIPKGYTSSNKTIRFPDDVIKQVEEAIRGTNCNFSQFIIEATRFALENLSDNAETTEDEKT